MQCIFNINSQDMEIYKYLLYGEKRVEEIAEKFGKDRSTIQRSLKRLLDCMMIRRKRNIIGKGGYYYTYVAIPPGEVKGWIKQCLDEKYSEMHDAIKNFEKELEIQ